MSDRTAIALVGFAITLALAAAPARAEVPRDPTQPPVVPTAPGTAAQADGKAPLELQAVFYADGRRIAIINDQRVGVDDTVSTARVIEIERDRVAVARDGETLELELVRTNVKHPAQPSGWADAETDAAPSGWADAETDAAPSGWADARATAPSDRGEPVPATDLPAAPAPVGEGTEQ